MMKVWNILPVISFTVLSVAGQISIGENLAVEGAGSFGFVSEDSSDSGQSSAMDIQDIIVVLDFDFVNLAAEVEIELGNGDDQAGAGLPFVGVPDAQGHERQSVVRLDS